MSIYETFPAHNVSLDQTGSSHSLLPILQLQPFCLQAENVHGLCYGGSLAFLCSCTYSLRDVGFSFLLIS